MAETGRGRKRDPNRRVYASEQKRPTMTFRMRDDLHAKLKASAEARGYSLSEEIEHRLNRSMDTAGDHFAEMALQLIADNWRAIQSLSRRKMVEDKFTLQACCEAAYRATELLAGVNGMDINIGTGLLAKLSPEHQDIEAGKQLGHAIVYHRELTHMENPPEWATSVYEANVIDALTKRVATMQARAAEQPQPASPDRPEPSAFDVNGPARDGETLFAVDDPQEPPFRLVGQDEATRLTAHGKRHPDVLPPGLGDRAAFDEAMTNERPDEAPRDPFKRGPRHIPPESEPRPVEMPKRKRRMHPEDEPLPADGKPSKTKKAEAGV